MKLTDFDYKLPDELIAQEPLEDRSASRLMVLDRAGGRIRHCFFGDLPDYLSPEDCLVLNQTRVLPARLIGTKSTGAKVEIFLLREMRTNVWEALCRPAKRLQAGAVVGFKDDVSARVVDALPEGRRLVEFTSPGPFREHLAEIGQVPLPPYIHHQLSNTERYQTVYSREEGSVAAPTAGLHFTAGMLADIKDRGVNIARLTLDIGLDTFRPVTERRIENHMIHSEKYSLPAAAANTINKSKNHGGQVVAVGTTCVRVLETKATGAGKVVAGNGETGLFIYPGYRFKIVGRLLTNFHLPRSTLLILVSAFAGRDLIMKAYVEAIREKYRFFSFGDAMLII